MINGAARGYFAMILRTIPLSEIRIVIFKVRTNLPVPYYPAQPTRLVLYSHRTSCAQLIQSSLFSEIQEAPSWRGSVDKTF